MLHGQHVFGQQFAGVAADDGDTQNSVFAGHRQHLHKALGLAVGNGAVQLGQVKLRSLKGDALGQGFLLVQADARDFGVHKGGLRHHAVVNLELFKAAKQRIDHRIPGLVRCCMRELVGPGHVTGGVDVGVNGLQVLVGLHRGRRGYAQRLQSVSADARAPADGANQLVKSYLGFQASAQVLQHQQPPARALRVGLAAQRLPVVEHLHAVGSQRSLHQG